MNMRRDTGPSQYGGQRQTSDSWLVVAVIVLIAMAAITLMLVLIR